VFNYVWSHPEKFKLRTFDPPNEFAFPEIKLDIDTVDDYRELSARKYRIDMSAQEIVDVARI